MAEVDDGELYRRGCRTLAASWDEYARGAVGAKVQRLPGLVAAVFPQGPEREVYNNALLERGQAAGQRADTLARMEAAYAAAGVARFAAWVHEGDDAMRGDLERRGYALDTTTLAMGMSLGELSVPRPEVDTDEVEWREYLEADGLPADFLAESDHAALHPLAVRIEGRIVAVALAYDLDADCGIFNVGTHEAWRRRGLGTAVTVEQLYRARERGCVTAGLQSTPMAEGVYEAAGLRELGRIFEYVPSTSS
ncbi:MAG TPA: GNAT family N-acetyltransferase [Actinocrinis sp.]|nr:GNAT family N-acetyltransferase [Actinocrinis sp.]